MAIWCEGNTSKTIQFFQGIFLSCIQNHREILYNFCHQRNTIVKFSKFTVINTIVILSKLQSRQFSNTDCDPNSSLIVFLFKLYQYFLRQLAANHSVFLIQSHDVRLFVKLRLKLHLDLTPLDSRQNVQCSPANTCPCYLKTKIIQ